MELTYEKIKNILKQCPVNTTLIELIGNDDYKPIILTESIKYNWLKRCLLLKNGNGYFLAINPMGSHFTGKGKTSIFVYADKYWDL